MCGDLQVKLGSHWHDLAIPVKGMPMLSASVNNENNSYFYTGINQQDFKCISDEMAFISSAEDRGFEPRSGQVEDY